MRWAFISLPFTQRVSTCHQLIYTCFSVFSQLNVFPSINANNIPSSSSNWEPYQFVSCCSSYLPVNCYLCMAFTLSSTDLLPCSSLSLALPRFVLTLTALLHSLLFICARFRRMNWPLLSPGSGREFIFVGQVFQNVIFDRNYPTK